MEKRYACDALILGSLMKSAKTHKIWPIPTTPYAKMTLRAPIQKTRSLTIMAVRDSMFTTWYSDGEPYKKPLAHGNKERIHKKMNDLKSFL